MPFDRKLYPRDWPAISKRIRHERAGGKCECSGECGADHGGRCAAPNGEIVWWEYDNPGVWHSLDYVPVEKQDQREVTITYPMGGFVLRRARIVLTVSHLNHTPMDCRDENLLGMCQACHLRYDQELHKRNAAETRRRKCGEQPIPFEATP